VLTLPTWMRGALFVTAGMNLVVAAAFLPVASRLRTMVGMPVGEHPLYLAMITMFVLLFGLGYLWAALAGRADRLFIAVAAVGKVSFFALLVCFWAAGVLPVRAPVAGAADLLFGILFFRWLSGTRSALPVNAAARPARG
jgi:hypothetical protein